MQLCAAAGVMFIKDATAVRRIVEASDAISFALVGPTTRTENKRRLSERAMGSLVATEWTFCLSNLKLVV